MSKKLNFFSSIILVAVLFTAVTGCGPVVQPTQTPVAQATQGTVAQPTQTPEAKPVTLTVWTGYPELEPVYKAVADQFKVTHPNVKFEFLSTTLREFETKLQAALPTCTGPDIFDVEPNIAPILVANQLIDPNPPAVDALVKSGAYAPFVVNYFTYDGKTYGIPQLDGSIAQLYYNKDMFTAAGLDPNKPPTTFDEMMADAQKLVQYDAAGNITVSGMSMRLSGQGSGIAEKFWFFLHNMGGDIIVPIADGTKWHNGYDNEVGRKALKYYIDSVYKYHVVDQKVPADAAAFEAGQTAMLIRESWVISEIATKAPTLNYGVAPMPRDVKFDTLTQPAGIYVAQCSKNPDLAWEYAQLYPNQENTMLQINLSGWISPRKGDYSALVATIPQYQNFVNPPEDSFYAYPLITSFDELETKMADSLVQAYLDKSLLDNPDGIARTIKAMAAETDSILTQAGVYGK
jgi:multiple sugar transport system substrate-binding protein